MVVLSCREYLAETTQLRHQTAQIVLHSYTGLRLPSVCLRQSDDGKLGVYCVQGSFPQFKPVEMVYQGDDYVLVSVPQNTEGLSTLRPAALLHRVEKWMLIDFLFNGSYYHLWYMVGVIYSTAMIYLICKLNLSKVLLPLAIVCYVIGLLGTSYYGIGSRLTALSVLFDSGWFLSVRRIFLMGFPFTALGWTISEGKLKLRISKKHLLFATTMVALLFVAEIVTVTVTGMSRTIEITVFLYPLLFLLFQICLAYPLEGKSKLASACRDTANFTYFWHPIVILALRRVVNVNFFLFTITTAICLLLGFGYHSLKNRRRLTYERHSKK